MVAKKFISTSRFVHPWYYKFLRDCAAWVNTHTHTQTSYAIISAT